VNQFLTLEKGARREMAHDLRCSGAGQATMANKMKMLTLLQEKLGYSQITNRRPSPRPAVLYLQKLRAQAGPSGVSRRRLFVSGDSEAAAGVPLPVKINHVKPETRAMRLVVR
jgi:hypothetical protein